MKKLLIFLMLICIEKTLYAQQPYIYTIKADSVKITNTCDTAELIIENHTQNVPGFLFNKGRGRTEFRRGLLKITDSLYIVGGDTLRMNPWLQGGNRFGTIGSFGTMDDNPIDFYTNGQKRGRWANTGNLIIGNGTDNGYNLQVTGTGSVNISSNLSRPNDKIIFGGYINKVDGQNLLISTHNGTKFHAVLMERDGSIGIGSGSPYGWNVGTPTIRISSDGTVSFASQSLYFGNTPGPYNASALITSVSNTNEWRDGLQYPNGQNWYYFGTILRTATGSNSRAPLLIGAKSLKFFTGVTDAEAVRITDAQNVIIGASNDLGHKLQLNGTFYQGGGQTATFGNGLFFDLLNSKTRIYSESQIYYQSNSTGDQHYFTNAIGTAFTGTFVTIDPGPYPALPDNQLALKVFGKNYTQGMVVDMAGRIGMGTTTPTAQLHTTNTVRFAGLTNSDTLARIVVSDANGNLYYRNASSLAVNEFMNSDLAVNGRVSAQKMLITQTGRWPDYVFSKQYQLPSLTEVENFIKQNNHLPGIPSAAEVEKTGIDVGNNQAALLKKIEELTLYVIEQNKKIQKQNEELAELKRLNSDMESLKQQLNELRALINNRSTSGSSK